MKRALQAGFTLIELVVVIVILGILAAVAIPQFTDLSSSAKQAVGNAACGAVQSAAVLLYASNKTASANTTIYDAVTVTGGTFTTKQCTGGVFTNSDGSTTTTCSAIPVALCTGT